MFAGASRRLPSVFPTGGGTANASLSKAAARALHATTSSMTRLSTETEVAQGGASPLSSRRTEAESPDAPAHHRVKRGLLGGRKLTFESPWNTWHPGGLRQLLKWQRERKKMGVDLNGWLTWNKQPTKEEIAGAFPIERVDWERVRSPPSSGVQATWVGHSTALVQLDGISFLTDPIFSRRCSPSQLVGPERVTPPAFTVADMAKNGVTLDFVVISHSHYDHLDLRSVKALRALYGPELTWYVPLGLAPWMRARGISRVVELDWWESARFGPRPLASPTAVSGSNDGIAVTLTPAQHWSSRTPFDRNESLWGGWAVRGPTGNFWFAGDTGYCETFRDIGARLGPFDLAAVPIGAYAPKWFLKPQHVDPADAVRIHQDVRAHASLAVHHGTFCLADEALDEPTALLAEAVGAAGLHERAFRAPRHGATVAAALGGEHAEWAVGPVVPQGARRGVPAAPQQSPQAVPLPDARSTSAPETVAA